MATLRLTDSAFGTVGLTITEAISLASISQQLTNLLGVAYRYDSLDVSSVTRGGLSAQGIGLAGSRVTVGDFSLFDPQQGLSGFSTLAVSQQSIAAHGTVFDIGATGIFAADDDVTLSYDGNLNTIDFSATGTAALDVLVAEVASFDQPGNDIPYQGWQVIGNAGDNVFYGNDNEELPYNGSDAFFAGAGNDTILGGLGSELLEGGAGNDLLIGGGGDDLLLGHLRGSAGGAGSDLLFGGEGFDELIGGGGNDALFLGQGIDILTGGAGRDRFYAVEDYDIVVGAGEEPLIINTGTNISESLSLANQITDFTAAGDTLVFAVFDGFAGIESFGFVDLSIVDDPAGRQLFVTISDGQGQPGQFVIEDTQSAVTTSDILLQLTQTSASIDQDLRGEIFLVDEEASVPVSFEVRYTDASQSDVFFGIDRFEFLQLDRPAGAAAGDRAGQDKFDLTGLNLGLEPAAIEDILFTTGEDFGEFTIEGFSTEDDPLENFFFDSAAGVDRAVHVEVINDYSPSGSAIAVYVDADADGDFSDADMAFIVDSLVDEDGAFYSGVNPLSADDLYNDSGDGSGTGIFIFNEEQYDLWFNDTVTEPQP